MEFLPRFGGLLTHPYALNDLMRIVTDANAIYRCIISVALICVMLLPNLVR